MPTEVARKKGKKTITLPNNRTVDIPVITEITFFDPVERGQQFTFTINDSSNAKRQVHVDEVTSSTGSDGSIAVERIDKWIVYDMVERGQETEFAPNNFTVGTAIPHFPHFKTHLQQYTNQDGDQVVSEYIDEIHYLDPVDRGQETFWVLDNTGSNVQLDGSEPNLTGAGGGDDPPYRTDPFQNIVDFRSQSNLKKSPVYGICSASFGFTTGSYSGPPAGQTPVQGVSADYPFPPWNSGFIKRLQLFCSATVYIPDNIIDNRKSFDQLYDNGTLTIPGGLNKDTFFTSSVSGGALRCGFNGHNCSPGDFIWVQLQDIGPLSVFLINAGGLAEVASLSVPVPEVITYDGGTYELSSGQSFLLVYEWVGH